MGRGVRESDGEGGGGSRHMYRGDEGGGNTDRQMYPESSAKPIRTHARTHARTHTHTHIHTHT